MEGLACMIAGILGTGNATTSHSGSIALIGITKVSWNFVPFIMFIVIRHAIHIIIYK